MKRYHFRGGKRPKDLLNKIFAENLTIGLNSLGDSQEALSIGEDISIFSLEVPPPLKTPPCILWQPPFQE